MRLGIFQLGCVVRPFSGVFAVKRQRVLRPAGSSFEGVVVLLVEAKVVRQFASHHRLFVEDRLGRGIAQGRKQQFENFER